MVRHSEIPKSCILRNLQPYLFTGNPGLYRKKKKKQNGNQNATLFVAKQANNIPNEK